MVKKRDLVFIMKEINYRTIWESVQKSWEWLKNIRDQIAADLEMRVKFEKIFDERQEELNATLNLLSTQYLKQTNQRVKKWI